MRIVLGVSSSVAIYKALELARVLMAEGGTVTAVMTPNATRLVDPRLFDALTGNRTVTDLFDRQTAFAHLETARSALVFAVVPATANVMAKLAHGIADDALTTTALAVTCPRLVAPAMNPAMWAKEEVGVNVKKLAEFGYMIVPPASGKVACGDEGVGRLADVGIIAEEIFGLAQRRKPWIGKRVVINAGPTREPWDAVRVLTNPSTGLMGHEIARRAARRGASVSLITGAREQLAFAERVEVERVETAEEMLFATKKAFENSDLLIAAAAVADYHFEKATREHKVKKSNELISINLQPTTDILTELSRNKGDRLIIGFAAETDNLVENASDKLLKKNIDMVIGNVIGRTEVGFGAAEADAVIIRRGQSEENLGVISKAKLAEIILDRVETIWEEK